MHAPSCRWSHPLIAHSPPRDLRRFLTGRPTARRRCTSSSFRFRPAALRAALRCRSAATASGSSIVCIHTKNIVHIAHRSMWLSSVVFVEVLCRAGCKARNCSGCMLGICLARLLRREVRQTGSSGPEHHSWQGSAPAALSARDRRSAADILPDGITCLVAGSHNVVCEHRALYLENAALAAVGALRGNLRASRVEARHQRIARQHGAQMRQHLRAQRVNLQLAVTTPLKNMPDVSCIA